MGAGGLWSKIGCETRTVDGGRGVKGRQGGLLLHALCMLCFLIIKNRLPSYQIRLLSTLQVLNFFQMASLLVQSCPAVPPSLPEYMHAFFDQITPSHPPTHPPPLPLRHPAGAQLVPDGESAGAGLPRCA